MRDRALPPRGGLGIERLHVRKTHDSTGIELEWIAEQAVESGRGDVHVALLGRRVGRRTRIRSGSFRAGQRPRQRDRFGLPLTGQHLAQKRLDAEQETRRNRRAALVALGPAQDHFGGAHRRGKVMSRKANSEITSGYAKRAQDRRRKQRIDPARGRPGAFVEPGADHQIGAVHAAFEQAENLHPRMPAIGRPHRDRLHRIAQRHARLVRRQRKTGRARVEAKILDEGGKRAAVLPCP